MHPHTYFLLILLWSKIYVDLMPSVVAIGIKRSTCKGYIFWSAAKSNGLYLLSFFIHQVSQYRLICHLFFLVLAGIHLILLCSPRMTSHPVPWSFDIALREVVKEYNLSELCPVDSISLLKIHFVGHVICFLFLYLIRISF